MSAKRFLLAALCCLFAASVQAQLNPPPPLLMARAWALVDAASGQILAEKDLDARIEPASLTKLMTAYLAFSAIKQGVIRLEQNIDVSERAWKTGGSKMFIQPKKAVTVEQLLHGMIVQSGNDACIALAEAIAGSEEKFVEMMNREARRLGMSGTLFANATGLPGAQHYSTTRDLATLTSALIRDFPDFYPLYSKKEYSYNNIVQPNRNQLLWLDPTVDGVKTGHTETAGYCLVSSSKRGVRRLISVLVGASSENARAQESLKLLNFGFQQFDAVRLYEKNRPLSELRVYKGSPKKLKAGFTQDLILSLPKGTADRVKVELATRQPLLAPIQVGQAVGTLKVSVDDKVVGEYPVQALENVSVAGPLGRLWDAILLFFE